MRFLSETKLYKKIIKIPSYLNPVAGIFMIRQEKKHETIPFRIKLFLNPALLMRRAYMMIL